MHTRDFLALLSKYEKAINLYTASTLSITAIGKMTPVIMTFGSALRL
jgi:hypothetical protein